MSLWRKEPEQITFADVESFCSQGQREGIRLDYKVDMPTKLQKIVAAFANTMGGLVLLGVDMDRQSNQPILPLVGMTARPGIEDQITAICQDGIHPPVLPRMSLPLPVPSQPDRVVMVLRIDQSPEAPHAVDGQVYVRVGSQGRAYSHDHAHIDQIRLLLSRRDDLDRRRQELVDKEIRRGVMQLAETNLLLGEEAGMKVPAVLSSAESRGLPVRWVSIILVYPWRDLCQPKDCYDLLRLFGYGSSETWQKVPGGAIALREDYFNNRKLVKGIHSLSSKGHVYAMESVTETCNYIMTTNYRSDHYINYLKTRKFVEETVTAAHNYYNQANIELPGYLLVSMGFQGVFRLRMIGPQAEAGIDDRARGKRFVDDDFGADVTLTMSEFLSDSVKAVTPLLDQLQYGFDL